MLDTGGTPPREENVRFNRRSAPLARPPSPPPFPPARHEHHRKRPLTRVHLPPPQSRPESNTRARKMGVRGACLYVSHDTGGTGRGGDLLQDVEDRVGGPVLGVVLAEVGVLDVALRREHRAPL